MKTQALLLPVILLSVCGCGAKFTCPAPNGGLKCSSVSTVYEKALSGEISSGFRQEAGSSAKDSEEKPSVEKTPSISAKLETEKMIPLRTPPKIIRMWFAPWEDDDGDLNQGGYVFSEITDPKNRWIIGEKPSRGGMRDAVRFFSGRMPSKQREGVVEKDRLSRGDLPAGKKAEPAHTSPSTVSKKPVVVTPSRQQPVLSHREGIDEACKGSSCRIGEKPPEGLKPQGGMTSETRKAGGHKYNPASKEPVESRDEPSPVEQK